MRFSNKVIRFVISPVISFAAIEVVPLLKIRLEIRFLHPAPTGLLTFGNNP